MGELLICHESVAKQPYYLEGAGIHVYSVEELCYFIAESTYLLDASFMNEELCTWIKTQARRPELADGLTDLVRSGAKLSEFVPVILESTSYCTPREVQDILWIIRQMEEKSDFECSKIRADKLMEKGKYLGAIYEYRRLLDSADSEEADKELCGKIRHNLGTAYARLFLFEEAGECYKKAFELNKTGESLREYLMCFLCLHDEEKFKQKATEYQVDDMGMQEIRNELSIAYNSENTERFKEKMKELKAAGTAAGKEKAQEMILQWKEEYRRGSRV